MLAIDISTVDYNGSKRIVRIKAVRGALHPKFNRTFYYEYTATIDDGKTYTGTILHSYDNGAMSLVAKISRSIVAQQKAEREALLHEN